MRFGTVRIELQCLSRGADHLRTRFTGGSTADSNRAEVVVRTRQADVGQCKRRVLIDCLLEIANTLLIAGSALAIVQGGPAFEIALVGFRRDGTDCGKPLAFLPRDRNLDFFGNRLCHIALEGEYVTEVAVVGFGPEVLVGCATNQLGVYANATALPHD